MSASPTTIAIFAATSGHSGVDRIIKNLAPEIGRRGIRVDLLKVDDHGPRIEGEHENVRIVRLGTRHAYTSLIPLIRYLRREQPAALLSDKDRVNRTALLASRLAGVSCRRVLRLGTTVSRNLENKGRLERRLQTLSIRFFYQRADAVVVPSEGVRRDLIDSFGLPEDLVQVIHNPVVGTDLEELAAKPVEWPWPIRADDPVPVVIGVGELSARKDFAVLVQAFAQVRSKRPCRLLLVGEGRQRKNLERLAAELGIADDVAFTGFVPNPYPYIRRANVLALTSRWEGMGVVLAEALGLGTQVIATDCPSGPREVLQDGRVGRLATVGSVTEVAVAIEQTLDHPFPESALRDAAARYRVDNSASAYLRVLGVA